MHGAKHRVGEEGWLWGSEQALNPESARWPWARPLASLGSSCLRQGRWRKGIASRRGLKDHVPRVQGLALASGVLRESCRSETEQGKETTAFDLVVGAQDPT